MNKELINLLLTLVLNFIFLWILFQVGRVLL